MCVMIEESHSSLDACDAVFNRLYLTDLTVAEHGMNWDVSQHLFRYLVISYVKLVLFSYFISIYFTCLGIRCGILVLDVGYILSVVDNLAFI